MIVIRVGGISNPEFLIADHAIAALTPPHPATPHRMELFLIQLDIGKIDTDINDARQSHTLQHYEP